MTERKARVGIAWSEAEDDILLAAKSYAEVAKKTGRTKAAVKSRMDTLRARGVDKRFSYVPEVKLWTAELDAIVMQDLPLSELVRLTGRTYHACQSRRKYISDQIDREPVSKSVRDDEKFMAALARHERPPSSVAVRDRQPLTYNPSLFIGSACSSSAAMAAEVGE